MKYRSTGATGNAVAIYKKSLATPGKLINGEVCMNRWLYRAACLGITANIDEQVLYADLETATAGHTREILPREIARAIANASPHSIQAPSGQRRFRLAKPLSVQDKIKNIKREFQPGTLADLRSLSSIQTPGKLSPLGAFSRLFDSKDWICLANDNNRRGWQCPLENKPEMEMWNLVVPNPARKRTGRTCEGKESPRAQECFEAKYLVCEIDLPECTLDLQAQMILGLINKGLSIRAVVYSGNKSLHAWIQTDADMPTRKQILNRLTQFGVDTSMATLNQLTRTPNAFRGQRKQELIYIH